MKDLRRCITPAILAIVAASFAPSALHAATAAGTLNVSATVVATCSVATTDLVFGAYSGTQLDGVGWVNITCTNLASYTVELGAGTGPGATVTDRKLTGPSGQVLNYSLYRDASRSSLWGDAASLQSLSGTGTGALQALTVYGRMPAAQTPGAGLYTDTVTVTVTY